MESITLASPAKINLFLKILGRIPHSQPFSGYHRIQSAMQPINWYDHLSFTIRQDQQVIVKLSTPSELDYLESGDNIIYQAAIKLKEQSKQPTPGVTIELKKNIPIGAGLGGGSSNAATTLLALNHLWQLNLSKKTLLDIGLTLGADVNFFLFGTSAIAENIGEQLSAAPYLKTHPYLMIIPNCSVNTQSMYQDPQLIRNAQPVSLENFQIGMGSNDFEPLAIKQYPEIKASFEWIKEILNRYQIKPQYTQLSGSGCAIFSHIADQALAQQTIIAASSQDFIKSARIVQTLSQNPVYQQLKSSS